MRCKRKLSKHLLGLYTAWKGHDNLAPVPGGGDVRVACIFTTGGRVLVVDPYPMHFELLVSLWINIRIKHIAFFDLLRRVA